MNERCVVIDQVGKWINRQRLIDTTMALCQVYSPTRSAGEVSNVLAELLSRDGLAVERPTGGWDAAPAVAVRLESGAAGRTLQFDGHLDTVHLPFVPPAATADRITGSGSCDMKGGVAAAVEALRAVRDSGLLTAGSVLFTAHDLHEAPWGDGSQLDGLVRDGWCGDGVLIPEYQRETLAVRGRGQAVMRIWIRRPGAPVHEVMRPNEPSVIAAGAELVQRLLALNARLAAGPRDEFAGQASAFIGQVHSGEIYNQYPQVFHLEGTRRWLPGTSRAEVEAEYRSLIADVAHDTETDIEAKFFLVRDAFDLPLADPLVDAFQGIIQATQGAPLPLGGKPFVDDGNTFWAPKKRAAITHGPLAGGAHTLDEWVSIDDLVRVAAVYAATAVMYCRG